MMTFTLGPTGLPSAFVCRCATVASLGGGVMNKLAEALLHPERLYTALDVASRPRPVPASPCVYAFYFNEAPPGVGRLP
jgi:hypothetical protein